MKGMHDSFFLLLFLMARIASGAPPIAKNNCTDQCGDVKVPYPFGIGEGCYNTGFQISCNETTPLLTSIQMEVLNISGVTDSFTFTSYIDFGQYVTVKTPIASQNCNCTETSKPVNLKGSPFFFSDTNNRFVAAGCNNRASINGTESEFVGCESSCNASCNVVIPSGLQEFSPRFEPESGSVNCKLAFMAENDWYDTINKTDPSMLQFKDQDYVPTTLNWQNADQMMEPSVQCLGGDFNSTSCYCNQGYEGNPYLPNGCQDIDECKLSPNPCGKETCVNKVGSYECQRIKFWVILGISICLGVLLLFIAVWWLYKFLKKRRQIKQKKKFFKRNGGFLLQQQMFPRLKAGGNGIDKTKIFDSKELDMATDHFNKNRILGQGGQGTVFKGMLVDGRIVAIKRSIVVDAYKVEVFINEVVILSQINHRNVVKLLGCCLETEVPLLVYEFVPNGTLSQYLHDRSEEFQFSWEMRLRIAKEVAEALSYLHSSASIPIYHRDIKSTNILLDDKYRAKVSDFGTSRSVPIDQTHLTATNVQGTFGYLDPEYLQSSQFSDKSDVYSFGVVLVELITGQEPVSLLRAQQERSLATLFILSMDENRLFDIVDAQIMKDSRVQEEIVAVAHLAYRCLSLSGRKRPTMREVAIELEGISTLQKATIIQEKLQEVECATTDVSYTWNTTSTSTGSGFDVGAKTSLEMENGGAISF